MKHGRPDADQKQMLRRGWAKKVPVPVGFAGDTEYKSLFTCPEGIHGLLVLRSPGVRGCRWLVRIARDGGAQVIQYDTGPASSAYIAVPATGATVQATRGVPEATAVGPSGILRPQQTLDPHILVFWHPGVRSLPAAGQTVEWLFSDNAPVGLKSGNDLVANATTVLGYPPLARATVRASRGIQLRLIAPGGDMIGSFPAAPTTNFEVREVPPWARISAILAVGANATAAITWRDV